MRSSELDVGLDTALRGLVDLERERAQLHRREVRLLIALHRGAGQYVVGGAPGAERMHGLDSRGDTWDEDGRFVIVESAESEEVGAVRELIRRFAAAVDITPARPPRVILEVTIPVHLLAGSDRATAGTTGPVCATPTRSSPAPGSPGARPSSGSARWTPTLDDAGGDVDQPHRPPIPDLPDQPSSTTTAAC